MPWWRRRASRKLGSDVPEPVGCIQLGQERSRVERKGKLNLTAVVGKAKLDACGKAVSFSLL